MNRTTRVVGLAVAALTASFGTMLPASASRPPGCVAANLSVRPGLTDAATSHTYQRFRITNVGTHACRLFGVPTFRFHNAAGTPIGRTSQPGGIAPRVVLLAAGDHAPVTVGYVDPAVTLPSQCHARRAATVDFTLAYRPHVYHQPLSATVCTTRMYRPAAYPVGFRG